MEHTETLANGMKIYKDTSDGPMQMGFKGNVTRHGSGFIDTNGNCIFYPDDGQVLTIDCPEFGRVPYTIHHNEDGTMYAENGKTIATMFFNEDTQRWESSGFICCPYMPDLKEAPVVLDPENYDPRRAILTRYGKKLIEAGLVP
jgi:hypothetical protein